MASKPAHIKRVEPDTQRGSDGSSVLLIASAVFSALAVATLIA